MEPFRDFFSASVGASAALVGLLFVAVTLAPARVFGLEAHPKRRADAGRAFIALGNVFFVSLAGLIPQDGIGVMLVVAVFSCVRLIREAIIASRIYSIREAVLSYGFASLGIYVAEFILVLRVALGYDSSMVGLIYVIFGLYAFALHASWRLLGAHDTPVNR